MVASTQNTSYSARDVHSNADSFELSIDAIKDIQLNLLKKLQVICSENGLQYFLAFGTLLGAVRHKGYIPWDDDIDVMMPRKDYEEFARIFAEDSEAILFSLLTRNGYSFPFYKLSWKNTRLIEETEAPVPDLGVNIDIFPIDSLPENRVSGFLKQLWLLLLKATLTAKHLDRYTKRSFTKRSVLLACKIVLKPLPANCLAKKIDMVARDSREDTHKKLGCIVGPYNFRGLFNYSDIRGAVNLPFEKDVFQSPRGYHEILKSIYGDYMRLPPESAQTSHHSFRAYMRK